MKPIPPEILRGAPEGTQWFGGPVDRSTLTLRVNCNAEECEAISQLLGHASSGGKKSWRLSAPESSPADLDAQVEWILSKVTADLAVWHQLNGKYKIDMFCGLFMERQNRGVSLQPETMAKLAERRVKLGFDIYAQ